MIGVCPANELVETSHKENQVVVHSWILNTTVGL